MRISEALLRRAAAHRAVLAVAGVTVLLTLTLTTTVVLLHTAARDVATATVLGGAATAERVVQVQTEVDPEDDPQAGLARLDERVRAALDDALTGAEVRVTSRAVSTSYALPGPDPQRPDLTAFATYDDLTQAAQLVKGQWPSGASGAGAPVPVAMSQPAAAATRREVGDRWTVRNRLTDAAVDVRLTGVFELTEPRAPARFGDSLLARGVEAGSFTTYGPLVVTRDAFAELFLDDATLTWVADPGLAGVRADDLGELRAGVEGLTGSAEAEGWRVESDLEGLLGRVRTPLTAVTAVVAVGVAPLTVVAALALLTAGRLLRDRRAEERALLQARGASSLQLSGAATAEALALTVPAVTLAPWLAAALVGVVDPAGEGAGVTLSAWVVALLAGLGVVVALVVPLLWRAEAPTATVATSRRAAAVRVVAEVVVVAGAALAAWQLVRYDGALRPDPDGRAQVDPLLVLAPALLVLAGCVLALRLLPLLLAAADPLAGRSRGLTGALATWTVGRRLGRLAGPVLTVLLAGAVVAFSLTWLASWGRSTHDQAGFAVGADLRVDDPAGTLEVSDVAEVPGVGALTPVVRLADSFGDLQGQVVALDPATAGDVVALRADLATQPLPTLLGRLRTPGTDQAPVLPTGSRGVALVGGRSPRAGWQVVVQDAAGLVHAAELAGPRQGSVRADLAGFAQPLRVLGLRSVAGADPARLLRLAGGDGPDLRALRPDGSLGSPLTAPPGTAWQAGTGEGRAVLPLVVTGAGGAVPALVTRELGAALGGEDLVADGNGLSLRLRPVGVIEAMPGVDPDSSEAVVVDLRALAREVFVQTGDVGPTSREWWVDVDGEPQAVARALDAASEPADVTVSERTAEQEAIGAGPVGTALVGVLLVALVAAALASVSGFAAATSALGPARRTEAAWLRALGADRRQVGRLQAVQRAGLLAVAGAAGIVVGLGVAWWAVPRISLADDAAPPFPTVEVVVPWGALGLSVAGLVAALAVLGRLEAHRSERAAPVEVAP